MPPDQQPAIEPAAATPPAPAEPPKPPEKTLSPVERAAKAWDGIRTAAEARAREAEKKNEAPAEAAKTEPAPKPTEKPEPPTDPLSDKFAQVAKLERRARETLKTTEAEKQALAKREAEVKAREEAMENRKKSARENPIAWLQEAGLSYEDAVAFQLNGTKPKPADPVVEVKSELERLKQAQTQEREAAAKAQQEREQAEHNAKYAAWASSVVDFVKKDESKYKLTNKLGQQQLVAQVIQQRFDESSKAGQPVVLKPEEAAELVEKYLREQAEATAKLLQEDGAKPPPAETTPAEPAQPRSTPTLNNGLIASASSNGQRRRTEAERKAAALAAMTKSR